MTSETDLKPCGHCGGVAEDTMRTGAIVCIDCGASAPNKKTWNARDPTTNPQTARILQHLIKTEGLNAAYVWLGEIAVQPGETT